MTITAFNVIIYSITSILLTTFIAPDEPLECSVGPYVSRTVIQSSFGTGEGEFGTAMWLSDGDYPAGLAVDDNGNIWQILIFQYKLRVVAWEITATESEQTIANSDTSDSSDLITAAYLGYTERVKSLLDEGDLSSILWLLH